MINLFGNKIDVFREIIKSNNYKTTSFSSNGVNSETGKFEGIAIEIYMFISKIFSIDAEQLLKHKDFDSRDIIAFGGDKKTKAEFIKIISPKK